MNSRFLPLLCALALGGLSHTAALAQAYPSKPVRFVVGSSPGNTPDVIARLVARKLSDSWGVQVYVENRTGASGTLASEQVAKSAPDGYTFLLADSSSWAINPHLYKKLPYDPDRDLTPVIQFGTLPMFLMVKAALPAKTTQELIAHARKAGTLTYGSAGNGSIHHITAELFKSQTGATLMHVPYRGGGPLAVALMAGEVDIAFMGYTSAQAGIETGKVRMLAVGTDKRVAPFPDLPTVAEAGLAGFSMYASVGILAPAGTPTDIIAKVNAAAAAAVSSADIRARLFAMGITVAPISPAQFDSSIKTERAKFAKLVKLSGAQVD
jgi:tripartite-type tricarboxylate transporter receptor subunit TctC